MGIALADSEASFVASAFIFRTRFSTFTFITFFFVSLAFISLAFIRSFVGSIFI